MPSLVQLEYIVAVDTWRHFATAAEKSFVTQPTLSMQIKKLEEELGLIIFDRSRQPVVPTLAGEAIIKQARTVLNEALKITELVRQLQGQIAGELKVGIIPTLSPYLLPRFAGNFLKKYPEVTLQITEMLTGQIIEALKKDMIDAGILVTPIRNQEINCIPLFYEKFVLYAAAGENITNLPYITDNQLDKTRFWLLASGHCFRSQALNICNAQRLRQQDPLQFESGSLETLIRLVDTEGGATLIPELAALDMPEHRQKQLIQFGKEPMYREVSLVYSRHFAKEHLLKVLEKEIRVALPQDMQQKDSKTIVEFE